MSRHATERLFWAIVWLAVALVGVKAYYLGLPAELRVTAARDYVRDLLAISYLDVLFAAIVWAGARFALLLLARRPLASRLFSMALLTFTAFCCLYAVAGIVIFWIFGGFLTYPLLTLIGDVRMVRSSVGAYLTPGVAAGLVGIPLVYAVLAIGSPRLRAAISSPRQSLREPRGRATTVGRAWFEPAIAVTALVWILGGHLIYNRDWLTRSDRRVADNAHWVLVESAWRSVIGDGHVRMADSVLANDLAEFEPPSAAVAARPVLVRRTERRPPLNVILIVLESVAARWTSLGGQFDTTPRLAGESSRSVVFQNFYAHIGRSSNSLAAMLLSVYPKLGFRDMTAEYPRLPGTSLAQVFRNHGYRTAFMTPSDLGWAGWDAFLEGRGFEEVADHHRLTCSEPVSSWGVEDRCAFEGIASWIERDRSRPFFAMAWTTQTHHPYEPSPGAPVLDFNREPIADEYDLERYLNVLHETDRHLGRLFDVLRRAGLADNTIVVVTGDHGQAFGYPHASYMQGRALYEEDVRVPLMFWRPATYRSVTRASTIGGHVDLAPTITELAGFEPATDWQGRSLFDAGHPPRAYFYVAEDNFTLGVREENWKYSIDLRNGVEELYDLDRDPVEQHNLAAEEPGRCARLRQRLAAWTEADRRRYGNAVVRE